MAQEEHTLKVRKQKMGTLTKWSSMSTRKLKKPSRTTQARSGPKWPEATMSLKTGLVTEVNEAIISGKWWEKARGWGSGRPSVMVQNWKAGKREKRRRTSEWWVSWRWECSVVRKVTRMAARERSSASLSMALMWPWAGAGKRRTWGFFCGSMAIDFEVMVAGILLGNGG